MDHRFFTGTGTGTACGLLGLMLTIRFTDIIQASVVAAVGATVSFLVTLLMKWIFRRRNR
jgi:hypothetical protein